MRITIINCAAAVTMFFAVSCNESEEEEETVTEAPVAGPGITEKKELSLDVPSAPNVYTLIEIVMFAYKNYPDVMNKLEAQGATAEQLWAAAWLLLEKGYSNVFIPSEGASLAIAGSLMGDFRPMHIGFTDDDPASSGGSAPAGNTMITPNMNMPSGNGQAGGSSAGQVYPGGDNYVTGTMNAQGGAGGSSSPQGVASPNGQNLVTGNMPSEGQSGGSGAASQMGQTTTSAGPSMTMPGSGGDGASTPMGQTTTSVDPTKTITGNGGRTSGQNSQNPSAETTKSIAHGSESSKQPGSTTTEKEKKEIADKMALVAAKDPEKRTELANASKNNVCGDPVMKISAFCLPSASSSCSESDLALDQNETCPTEKGDEATAASACDKGYYMNFSAGIPGCVNASEKPSTDEVKRDFGSCNCPTCAKAITKYETSSSVFCVDTSTGERSQ